jgi:hypothetical protein
MSLSTLLATQAGLVDWAANTAARSPPPDPKSDLGKTRAGGTTTASGRTGASWS